MNHSLLLQIVATPGITALLLWAVFSYLSRRTREQYFLAWRIAWGTYFVHSVLLGLYLWTDLRIAELAARLAFGAAVFLIYVSTQTVGQKFGVRAHYTGLIVLFCLWTCLSVLFRAGRQPGALGSALSVEMGLAVLLMYCAHQFLGLARTLASQSFRLLAVSVMLEACLLAMRQTRFLPGIEIGVFGTLLGSLPQMVTAMAMVMVLYEQERRVAHENVVAFSSIHGQDKEFHRLGIQPQMEGLLERLLSLTSASKGVIYITQNWRATLPLVQRGFAPEVLSCLEGGAGAALLARLQSEAEAGNNNLHLHVEWLSSHSGEHLSALGRMLSGQHCVSISALRLVTADRTLGMVLFGHDNDSPMRGPKLSLLESLAALFAAALENYVLLNTAQRSSKEYALLAQIGQAISSRLDEEEICRAVHRELGRVFDTRNFHVAFRIGNFVTFELEVLDGIVQPRHTRPCDNGIIEHIIKTSRPSLIRAESERRRVDPVTIFPSGIKSFLGVPIFASGTPGVMAVWNTEREFVYDDVDLNLMSTASAQVAVAIENARMFKQEQRRARYLGFLNRVSNAAISTQQPDQIMAQIVGEIQANFKFEHIGIGILNYAIKQIEIKAEAGSSGNAVGRQIALGSGWIGEAARTNSMMLLQNLKETGSTGILPDAESVLCLPITYGDTLLGVLNVESIRTFAFADEEVLILRTLADLLATALHNAFIFQKLEQQAITDSLTGIKTRRYFLEAVQSEWKRASRTGRPFSIVLMDVDKFKEVNDNRGHLEGDLVLARLGRLLEQKCRQSNVVARYGGDEFIILMPETGWEQAQFLAERLRSWIAADTMFSERHITGSFGVASYPLHGFSVEDIIRVADAGMYVSKRGGGNHVSTAEITHESQLAHHHQRLIVTHLERFLHPESGSAVELEDLKEALLRLGKLNAPEEEREVLREAIWTLTRSLEITEAYAFGHGDSVSRLAEVIGRMLRIQDDELEDLVFAARVHDVGKIVIPLRILNKQGTLSQEEFERIKAHSEVGAQIVSCIPDSARLQSFIRHHQERFNGTGYPSGAKGEEIPLGSRIIAVAEAYVWMTTMRHHGNPQSSEEALEILEAGGGTLFDGMVVRVLLQHQRGEKTVSAHH